MTQVYLAKVDTEKSIRVGSGSKYHWCLVQASIRSSQGHGSSFCSLPSSTQGSRKAQRELLVLSYLTSVKHLFPKRSFGIFHTHDTVGQLSLEETSNFGLTTKVQIDRKSLCMLRINIFRSLILKQGRIVHSSHIALIASLIGCPTGSFLIRHGNATFRIGRTGSLHAACAVHLAKSARISFVEIIVNVVLWRSAVATSTARKGSHATSSIDNDCLPLGRGSAPQINVMRSIAVIQGTNLQGFSAAAEIAIFFILRRQKPFFLQASFPLDVMGNQWKGHQFGICH
mmetsp:Transcript_13080/g.30957  ORF Transcript_13080/g.30957 Transcript_13080/m.30957 type:complete len:285 (-) Transcript_13080:389-1243(-)